MRLQQQASASYDAVRRALPFAKPGDPSQHVVLAELPPARGPGGARWNRVEVWVTGVAVFVLLIACGNVGNLMLVRGWRRGHELDVKAALGASRARLMREIFLEAVLLATVSGLAALFFVVSGGRVIRTLFLSPIAALSNPLDLRLVVLAMAVSTAAALLLATLPAATLTKRRTWAPGHAAPHGFAAHLVDTFIALQVALSVPLLVGAGLFVASFWHARTQELGVTTERVAIVQTNDDDPRGGADTHALYRRIQTRLAALPTVGAVALVQTIPMRGLYATHMAIPGKSLLGMDGPYINAVDPAYFDVVRPRLLAGRPLMDADNHASARRVAVVNDLMARTIWPGESALGKCLQIGGEKKACTEVVGVIGGGRKFASVKAETASMYLVPIEQLPDFSPSRALLVRTTVDPSSVMGTLRREAQAVGTDLPYVEVSAFDEILQPMLRPWRLGATLFVAFGAISLIIAAMGLAVVVAYGVTRRTRELGIRSALGATPQHLVALVLGRSIAAVCGGLAAGVVLAYVGGRSLESVLFGITPGDPRVFAVAAALLLAIGIVAAWLPARRAGRVDPAITLRTE